MTHMNVPFVDLKAQYSSIQSDIDSAIAGVIADAAFIGGPRVSAFEESFAEKIGATHCIGVANGTDAIYIVLKMLGIGEGDEVITVANSWISTSEVITQTGASVVFVDADEFYQLDSTKLEAAITPRTKAVIPVHLYGQACDLSKIKSICDAHRLYMVEDCAQAHLSEWDGRKVGTFGIAATFSFYPGKNLGAYGDAGAIVTSDEAFAVECRRYARHGALIKHQHTVEGINSRLDGIQAAILSAKLPHLDDWTEKRQAAASLYDELLESAGTLELPRVRDLASHVYHLYVVQVDQREQVQTALKSRGIQTAVHYPTALPLLPAYHYLGKHASDFPCASANQSRILSLPIYPEISRKQIQHVCNQLVAATDSN
ncbi:MAG: DegT/DnrJ/EryC1/StrS family aminotransferase [Pseudomonadota bacterium]